MSHDAVLVHEHVKEQREMLVLSRRDHETVLIGSEVVVTVLDIRGNQVRLGIEAPQNVSIDREEVRERDHHKATIVSERGSHEEETR